MTLEFNEEKHIYRVDGKVVPSVSEILEFAKMPLMKDIPKYILDIASDRGTRIHKATENIDAEIEEEIDYDIEPYVTAYKLFLAEYSPLWLYRELMLTNGKYAGTLDSVGIVADKLALGDYKSTSKVDLISHFAQLIKYRQLWVETGHKDVDDMFILYLKNDYTYQIYWASDHPKEFKQVQKVVKCCESLIKIMKGVKL